MDVSDSVRQFLSQDHLNLPEESSFINNTDSYQAIDATLKMLSDKDPLLPSSSEPFRLELQADGSEQCQIDTAEALRLGDVGAVITAVEEDEHDRASGLQESSQNSSNSEPNPVQPNRKSPRLHAPAVLESKDENKDQSARIIHPSSKEFKKTWGFRQTTIAKRENAMDAENSDTALSENSDHLTPLLRRSRRQTQRSARVQEFISAAQKRYRKMSGLDDGECGSIATSEAGTGSDGSVDVDEKGVGSLDVATDKGSASIFERTNEVANSEDSSTNSDSDELTLKELQNQLRKQRGGQEQPDSPQNSFKGQEMCAEENQSRKESKSVVTTKAKKKIITPGKKSTKSGPPSKEKESKSQLDVKSESDDDESSTNQSDNEYNDPDKLYCICRQPHNNRFMICCDRCEEWFHGDCVGITMARGRLLERNGEDYICPDCSPSSSKGSGTTVMKSGQQESKPLLASSNDPSSIVEKREGNSPTDQGIKGRIEKAVNPSGKKKIKIFKPAVEIPAVPKCIGPGCSNLASTDSVYCSNDCILKHAAATMKSLNQAKDQKQKTKGKSKTEKVTSSKSIAEASSKPLTLGPLKAEDLNTKEFPTKKLVVLVHKSPVPPQKETVSSNVAGTWTIDHNYNAVKPEKTLISASVFYRSLTPKDKTADSESLNEQPSTTLQSVSSKPSATATKQPAGSVEQRVAPKRSTTSQQISSSKQQTASKHQVSSKHSISTKQQTSTKQGSTGSEYRIPSKHSSAPKHTLYSSEQAPARKSADKQQVQLSAPATKNTSQLSNPQIRHNIRRSLKEILCKRVNDCDDLDVTEDTIGKIAVNIEKELFTLFQDTHSKYKSRYRSIMFNLKNPRNQGLFRRVVREEIVPFHLVRMSPEEIESKELAVWEERESRSAQDQSERLQHETKGSVLRAANKHEVDMEEAPPMSDADEQEDIRPAQKTSHPLPDIFSSMLKDTTDEHRAHLFDLNCRICTGKVQVSEDEPMPKKPKVVTKKAEPKLKSKPDVRCQQEQDKTAVTVSIAGENSGLTPQEMSSLPSQSIVTTAATVVTSQPTSETVSNSFISPANHPARAVSTERTSVTIGSALTPSIVSKPTLSAPSVSTAGSDRVMGRTSGGGKEEEEAPKSILTSAAPKSILTKPSTAPEQNYTVSTTVRISEAKTPAELDTSLFLSHLDAIWKGFINMHGVAKFVTKAYPVSGSIDYLVEDLPDTIHIGGRISPHTVWDYVGKLKSSLSKEVCLIRFHPATEEEEVTYISLYSYFNSRGRFGVVANNARHIKDLYLIPLAANDPIHSKLLPFEGPGLEKNRPNLILGLVIRQKGKRRPLEPEPEPEPESERGDSAPADEKRSRLTAPEDYPVPSAPASREGKAGRSLYGEGAGAGTPPGSPPLEAESEAAPTAAKAAPPPPAPAKVANPLQHILQTLFGGKKSFEKIKEPSPEPESQAAAPLLDPIVQQFGQLQEDKPPEPEDDDNRPYDPEEEYKPEADTPYDPADETILEEAMVPMAGEAAAGEARAKGIELGPELYLSSSLQEQQKMLETLNQQIEEQTRQVEEQEEALRQQRAAVGVSMACFSVSDALMSPPPKTASFKAELFEVPEPGVGQLPGLEPVVPSGLSQMIDQSRDPRQAAVRRLAPGRAPGEAAALAVDQPAATAPFNSPRLQEVAPQELRGPGQHSGEGPTPNPPTHWANEEPRAIAEALRPLLSQEPAPGPGGLSQPFPVVEQAHFPAPQPAPKGLLPTPILPSLLGPSYPGDRPAFPSPPRGSQSFGNSQENFHPGNMQQPVGPFPNFQHPNSQHLPRKGSDFIREPGPAFQSPKPLPLFPRGAPTHRYRFPGQTPIPGFNQVPHPMGNQSPHLMGNQSPHPMGNQSPHPMGNQSPHPMGNQSPAQQELLPAPGSVLKGSDSERLGSAQGPGPDSRDRERSRTYPGRGRDGRVERPENRYPAERFRRGEERRRDRDREYGRPWERERGRAWNRDWERNRERERNRSREREHDRDRYRRRERERGRDRERSRDKERERGREKDHDRTKEKERRENSSRNSEQEKEKGREGRSSEQEKERESEDSKKSAAESATADSNTKAAS
ncbi:death-inducer obliterator 1-like isoform X2 [Stegostoma tigrinum]|uniref:death-inducer obliterator 1-like isoform X2 n=1 Tax=Stegostoma tigrinum TaxID=3053191 RepID=UPI00286FFEF0|nr:death-inducer obliterator 1-like isoform X2 [Stegostoma tigrinum]